MQHQEDLQEAADTTKVSKETSFMVLQGGQEDSGKQQLLLAYDFPEQKDCSRFARKDVQHAALQIQDPPSGRRPRILFSLGKQKETEEKVQKVKKKRFWGLKDKKMASDPGGKHTRCKQNNVAAAEMKSPALIRAQEVLSKLEPGVPSFVKPLVRSHVGSCFWMGLPGQFCKAHLPNKECTVTLEDESGNQSEMKYLAYKTGLSAGWKNFCLSHQLLEGDVLVFQLVEQYKFKVYVIRANDLNEVDGALGLLNLGASELSDAGRLVQSGNCKGPKRKHQRPLTLVPIQKNKKNCMPGLAPIIRTEQSENDSEELGSEVLEGFKLSRPSLMFKDIESFGDFSIMVDGFSIDSEISEDIRIKYYKLCCSQNAFLHQNYILGINNKLVIGAITEIVNIADATRACKLTTTQDKYASWDRTLKALELLGMNVGFLRARIHRLFRLAYESEDSNGARKYVETKTKLEHTEDEIRNLEAKLVDLREACLKFGADIETLEVEAESYEIKFREEVLAFWQG